MNTILLVVAGVLLAAAAAAIFLLSRQAQGAKIAQVSAQERLAAKESEAENLRADLTSAQASKDELNKETQNNREEIGRLKTSLELERKQFEDKLELLKESREQLGISFKNIANEIFDDKSKKFSEHNKASLSSILNPLQDKIKQFEKRVEDTYDKESKERFSLAKEIKNLQELNNRISQEAVNLTNALKGDNKAQGNWGELVLETILEKSGLVKGREYDVQVSLKTESGLKSQPDIVVHLPESRDIIIDSKVSLKSWEAFCAADNDADADAKANHLKQHIQSVRGHVKSLSGKDYQNLAGLNTLDYVFLFMPIEAAYATAIQNDPDLSQYAFERNIIFVGPTTLLTTLKTVQNLWRLAQQNQNANDIAKRAGALYDKFVNFVADLDEVGDRIDASKRSFEKAQNKLHSGKDNLIRKVEVLKELGAKTSKKHKSELLKSSAQNEKSALPSPDSTPDPDPETETETETETTES